MHYTYNMVRNVLIVSKLFLKPLDSTAHPLDSAGHSGSPRWVIPPICTYNPRAPVQLLVYEIYKFH